ncbi:ankyrin [Exidia glandulosa HHB12029]|uniref:Ankyrin n=1 Tax=Exidia glandulosa HHB12029 TaxID=1314781 RepID=A0A165Q249_EXIGL|nr:ankyrin [Exidia glandulosa HHB12029]
MSAPSEEDVSNVLDACRYGDLDDVNAFLSSFSGPVLAAARDDRGNSALHMAAANGHVDVLQLLLPLFASYDVPNESGSTPLHWAALNAQMDATKLLVESERGGVKLIDVANKAGRTPLAEAELAGWDEGARWMVDKMDLEEAPPALDTDEPVPEGDEGDEDDVTERVAAVTIDEDDKTLTKS